MQAFIVSDNPALTVQVREILLREGHDCPATHVVSPGLLREQAGGLRAELAVIVLSPDPTTSLEALATLRFLTSGRLLAVGPAAEPKLILSALRAGADQYLDEADLGPELTTALARLRPDTGPGGEPGRLIAILAPSGGSGSSTVAANVATVLATEHRSCALFDLKLEAGDLAALLDLKPTHTLADLCRNATRMDRVMFERSLARHPKGVSLVAPPASFADVAHVTAEGVRQALTLARAQFPYVVVDLDHSFREEQLQVLRQADVILLVMRLDFTSLRNTHRVLKHLTDLGIDKAKVQVAVNRYGQPREIPSSKAEEALGLKIAHYLPDDPKTVNRANNNGVPVVLEAPSAKVSKCLARLAAGVNGRKK
jgi:pilus assembly protein CpaE